jgi:LmbE family N-acetylglucosaminyl deacetylase
VTDEPPRVRPAASGSTRPPRADPVGATRASSTLRRMQDRPLTLMAVHAHPDDEAIGTGGILARYAGEGVRTVLVTCTNGELGDAPGGLKPGDPGHEESIVVPLRRRELEASCEVLGVSDLELLGYHDSGMQGWPQNDAPGCFWSTPIDEPAGRLAELMRAYQPQVVVTYDENGFYGHPDHIQANRVTRAALAECGIPCKLYYTAVARSRLRSFRDALAQAGIEGPGEVGENSDFGTPDELITTTIDCSAVADRKYASLEAHASQSDNIFFLQMGVELFSTIMGSESFVRAIDTTDAPVPEDDLFAGLR